VVVCVVVPVVVGGVVLVLVLVLVTTVVVVDTVAVVAVPVVADVTVAVVGLVHVWHSAGHLACSTTPTISSVQYDSGTSHPVGSAAPLHVPLVDAPAVV
jgi:hypothetical protein